MLRVLRVLLLLQFSLNQMPPIDDLFVLVAVSLRLCLLDILHTVSRIDKLLHLRH